MRYRVEFHVSRNDSSWYAVRNVGAYFSTVQPPAHIDSLNSYEPQVRWQGGFLTDSEGWTRISGVFIAQGGEQFLTIGNFDGHHGTNTLMVPGGGVVIPFLSPWYYWHWSGYYIDDVAVYAMDSLTGTGGQLSMVNEQLSIHPNPASEYLIIETEGGSGTLRMLDMAGREVLSVALHSTRQQISVEGIPMGVYVAVVEKDGKAVARRKVIVE